MTDKKFTDEEIIKRLEYVRKNADEGYMTHLENGGEVDKNEEEYIDILCRTLDLINRQKSEIERLKECPNFKTVEQIKTEAYKEFAEKLENEINCRTTLSRQQDKNVIHIIHNLLKEMVSEERMTNEEAIIDIRENIQPIIGGKSLDIAISAIEKQIPKKPLHWDDCEQFYIECPCCGKRYDSRLGYKGCPYCLQAIRLE